MTPSTIDRMLAEKGYTKPLPPDVLEFILKHEGGLVEHPADPGGLTNWGISLRSYPWLGRDAILLLSREQAGRIYRKDYWDALRASEMPRQIALAAFDAGVNQGVTWTRRALQLAAQVRQDGILGPQTLGALAKNPDRILAEFMALRGVRYSENKNFKVFGLGWMRRLINVHEECMKSA